MPGQSNRPEGSSSVLLAGGWRVPRACSCRADLVLPRMPTLWPAGCESAGCCRGLLRPKSPVGKDSGGWPDALVIGRYGVDAFRPSDIPVGRVALPAIPLSRFPADADSVGIGSVSVPAGGFGLRILSSSVSWGNAAARDRVPSSPLCPASPPWVRCPAAWHGPGRSDCASRHLFLSALRARTGNRTCSAEFLDRLSNPLEWCCALTSEARYAANVRVGRRIEENLTRSGSSMCGLGCLGKNTRASRATD